ncbi:hypothetical protein ACLMJK_005025 [Lecanora helva]
MTAGSISGNSACHPSLSIRIAMQALDSVPQQSRQELGSSLNKIEGPMTYNSFKSHASTYTYPFTTLAPAQAGPASRRHSMTVQDMLNPSDEEPRGQSQSRSSPSSDNDSGRRLPGSYRVDNSAEARTPYNNNAAAHSPGPQQARINRKARRRCTRQASLSSSASEIGENGKHPARNKYSVEETHFIW